MPERMSAQIRLCNFGGLLPAYVALDGKRTLAFLYARSETGASN
jgi:hypothetical protein